jgi:hypothetical protein
MCGLYVPVDLFAYQMRKHVEDEENVIKEKRNILDGLGR